MGLPVWVPILAAILGAMAGGGLKAFMDLLDRRREDESILVALTSEVQAICDLLRRQNYISDIEALLADLYSAPRDENFFVVELRSNYFAVYHSLAHSLGRLTPSAASEIVRFYMNCKTIVDCTRPDGVSSQPVDGDTFVSNLNFLRDLLYETLQRGDKIVQMPKTSLPLLESK